jgi:hypothetical protein
MCGQHEKARQVNLVLVLTFRHPRLSYIIFMGFTNRTADFKDVLRAKQSAIPQPKRRKTSPVQDGPDSNVFGKQYLEEAYTIVCRNDVPCMVVLFLPSA